MYTFSSQLRRIFLLALLTFCIISAAPVRSQLTNGRIVFTSSRDGDQEIYAMEPDGQRQRRLTLSKGSDAFPKWSPDGRRIAFASSRDGNNEIYVMNADGTDQLRLTRSSSDDYDPEWSPDGKRLAFVSLRDGNAEIYLMKADGSGQSRITRNTLWDSSPAWSPDGSKIAFTRGEFISRAGIHVMNVDGSNVKALTTSVDLNSSPAWSPDGMRIVYSSRPSGGSNYDIWTISGDGTNKVRITTTADDEGAPRWSTDNSYLIFTRTPQGSQNSEVMRMDWLGARSLVNLSQSTNTDGGAHWTNYTYGHTTGAGPKVVFESARDGVAQIYAMDADGTNQTRLTLLGGNTPQVSPDGGRVCFGSARSGNDEIYTMSFDGSMQKRLTFDAGKDRNPRWCPDGSKIVFDSGDGSNSNMIYIMQADGSNLKRILFNLGFVNQHPCFSSDGFRIYFTSNRTGNFEIFRMELDGTGVVQITNDPKDDQFPVPAPDGVNMAFQSNRNGDWDVFAMTVDGSNVRVVTQRTGDQMRPCWNTIGSQLLHSTTVDGKAQIAVTNLTGEFYSTILLSQSAAGDIAPSVGGVDIIPTTTSSTVSPEISMYGWFRTDVVVVLTSVDIGYGVAEIHYSIDMGPEQIVPGDRAEFVVRGDGIHQLAYWGVDYSGNVEAPKYAALPIDTVSPITTSDLNFTDTLLTLTSTDNASGVAETLYSIDGASQQKYSSPITLDGKQHSVDYWSVDMAGNIEYSKTVLIGVGLKSLTLDRTTAVGGYTRTGRINLTRPAPAGGLNVLVWSDSDLVSVPIKVTVPAGQSSAVFDIVTQRVGVITTVVLSANIGDTTVTATLGLLPPSARISATPRTVVGGETVTISVALDFPAPAGGILVNLSSDNAGLIPLPTSMTVPEGQYTASVQVSSVPTQERLPVVVSASTSAQSAMATVLVDAPSPASVTLAPTTVNGGTGAVGTITLNGLAPADGYEVSLTSSSPVATVPASIVIAAGQTMGTFNITTRGVQQNTTVNITATANNVRRVGVLTVRSAAVASVQVIPSTVLGSQSAVGRVNLTTPAPDGGLVLDLTSSNTNVIIPASVRVTTGETFATFDVQTKSVTAQAVATLTATFNGVSRTTTLTVNALSLHNLSVSPSTVVGGSGVTAALTLNAPAPTGGVSVALASNNASVIVPATVIVAAGQSTATVDITTVAVSTNTNVTVTATFLGVSKTANFSVTAPGLIRLMLNPSSVVGGDATTVTIDLGSPAPPGGLVIALSSNRSDVLAPPTVIVPEGQTSISDQVLTKSVTTSTNVAVAATLNGRSVSNVVTLLPYRLASLAVAPSSVSGGSSFTGRVTLQQAAPAGGITVSLSNSDPVVSFPGTITIDAGKTTATFAGTTAAVVVTKNVTITATLNGNSVTDTLRVVQPGIKSISLLPSTVTGGTGSQLTVSLDAPAPVGGWAVNLTSGDLCATVATSATVAAGQTFVTVPVTTKSVLTRTAVTLTATDASGSQSTTLIVDPVVGLQLRLSSSSIAGGSSVNLTVELADAAPKTGATVALSADNASLVVPVSIKVLAGSKIATIAVKSLAVADDTTVRIAGTVNGFTDRAELVVTAPRPQFVSITPAAVLGSKPATGSLTITGLAPVGGLTVQLISDNDAASVPATVLVPAGKNVVTFVVTTKAVTSRTLANISTSANGTTVSEQLTVQALTVQSVVFKPSTVLGGTPSVGTVTLNGVAPAGGLQVDLTRSVAGVTVPAKVFVPAGKNVVSFTATTEPVGSNVEATLTARANGDQVAGTLLVTPVLVSSLTVAPTTVVGGTSATGTVKLAVAPGVDTVVTLSSANPTIASVPATVVVRKGTLTATFTVTTKKPAAQTAVTLSAVTGGAAKTVSVTVKP